MNPLDVYLKELKYYWAIKLEPNAFGNIGYISKTHTGYMAIHDPNEFNLVGVNWDHIDYQPVNGGVEQYICQLGSFEECIRRIKNSGINIHILMAQQEIK